jgi:hypothetical protein
MTEILHVALDGPRLGSERHTTDLVGEAYPLQATWVAIPLTRLAPDFFDLKTRVAGLFIQKLVNYGLSVAFVGDITPLAAQSEALAAFVRESNRGKQVWFVADRAELERKVRTA